MPRQCAQEYSRVIANGCMYHSHRCALDAQERFPIEKYHAQIEKEAFLRAMGYTVKSKWECEIKHK